MSNPEMILAFDAYRDLKYIVDKKGADYVYEGAYHDNCMYWDYDEDTPSCLVGPASTTRAGYKTLRTPTALRTASPQCR